MARTEPNDLSPEAEERIARVVHSLVDDHVERGVDLSRPMHCSSCDLEKPALGSAQYGAYQLCNDCLLDFTRALARGEVENVAEYMTRRPDDEGEPPPPDPSPTAAKRRMPVTPLPKRGEKLMPRNEPC